MDETALLPTPDLWEPEAALQEEEAPCVLVVDDVPDNLTLLHDALDEAGYTVLLATSGAAALARAAQALPDVILLDAVMPGLDGFEVTRQLKADSRTASIPVVFMTGLTETEHLVQAYAAGAVDYVTKPLRPPEVLARMSVHLGAARRAQVQQQRMGQARKALDAFGYASMTVRTHDGRLLWQTALARDWLHAYYGPGHSLHAPEPVALWLREQSLQWQAYASNPSGTPQEEPPPLIVRRPGGVLRIQLHQPTGEGSTPEQQASEWLLVLREQSETANIERYMAAWQLTAREAEVLHWLTQGKTNRDIAEIVGSSPATVKKHLERVYAKLGVETRTAAAGMALARAGRPQG